MDYDSSRSVTWLNFTVPNILYLNGVIHTGQIIQLFLVQNWETLAKHFVLTVSKYCLQISLLYPLLYPTFIKQAIKTLQLQSWRVSSTQQSQRTDCQSIIRALQCKRLLSLKWTGCFAVAYNRPKWQHTSHSTPSLARTVAASRQWPTDREWDTKVTCVPETQSLVRIATLF